MNTKDTINTSQIENIHPNHTFSQEEGVPSMQEREFIPHKLATNTFQNIEKEISAIEQNRYKRVQKAKQVIQQFRPDLQRAFEVARQEEIPKHFQEIDGIFNKWIPLFKDSDLDFFDKSFDDFKNELKEFRSKFYLLEEEKMAQASWEDQPYVLPNELMAKTKTYISHILNAMEFPSDQVTKEKERQAQLMKKLEKIQQERITSPQNHNDNTTPPSRFSEKENPSFWSRKRIELPLSEGRIPEIEDLLKLNAIFSKGTVPAEFRNKRIIFFESIINNIKKLENNPFFPDFLTNVLSWNWATTFLDEPENRALRNKLIHAVKKPILIISPQTRKALTKEAEYTLRTLFETTNGEVSTFQSNLENCDSILKGIPIPLRRDFATRVCSRYLLPHFDLRFYYELEKTNWWKGIKKIDHELFAHFENKKIEIENRAKRLIALSKLSSVTNDRELELERETLSEYDMMNIQAYTLHQQKEGLLEKEKIFRKENKAILGAMKKIFDSKKKLLIIKKLKSEEQVQDYFKDALAKYKKNKDFDLIIDSVSSMILKNSLIKTYLQDFAKHETNPKVFTKPKEIQIADKIFERAWLKKKMDMVLPRMITSFYKLISVQKITDINNLMSKYLEHISLTHELKVSIEEEVESLMEVETDDFERLSQRQFSFGHMELLSSLEIFKNIQLKSMELGGFSEQNKEMVRRDAEKAYRDSIKRVAGQAIN